MAGISFPYGTLETLVSYEIPAFPAKARKRGGEGHAGNGLETLVGEKVRSVADILADLRHDMGARQLLSLAMLSAIQEHYLLVKNKFLQLDHWPQGGSRLMETRRSALEAQLDVLLREERQERVKCWEDIAKLKKEFRQWHKQYADLVQRSRIILSATHEGDKQHESRY